MGLKMLPADFDALRAAVQPLDTVELREVYIAREFPHADVTKDVNMRYRWDLVHKAGVNRFLCDTLYTYLDDTHIDSALRSIVPPL